MRHAWVSRVGMLTMIGIMVLSASLVLMDGNALAAPPTKPSGTQNWDSILPADQRFTVLAAFGGAAVRDNETGLVWEQSPDAGFIPWFAAAVGCANKSLGGRKGWRLPSIPELASLVDPTQASPSLPVGHPFTTGATGAQSAYYYWSATTLVVDPGTAWVVNFFNGIVGNGIWKTTNDLVHAWCVRGGMNADQY